MSKPVNLNKYRKARARTDARQEADRNAAFHGLTKVQKEAARKENERAEKQHIAGRREDDLS